METQGGTLLSWQRTGYCFECSRLFYFPRRHNHLAVWQDGSAIVFVKRYKKDLKAKNELARTFVSDLLGFQGELENVFPYSVIVSSSTKSSSAGGILSQTMKNASSPLSS